MDIKGCFYRPYPLKNIVEDAIRRGIIIDFFYESSIDWFEVSRGWTITYPDGRDLHFGDNLAEAFYRLRRDCDAR
jgi:hypothetical protein